MQLADDSPSKAGPWFSMCLLKNFFFSCCSHKEYVAQINSIDFDDMCVLLAK